MILTDITEEDVYDHFKNIGAIECVQKPAVNYAYVSFERSESTQRALAIKNRNLKGVDIEVFPVKRNISMMLEKPKLLTFADIQDKCEGRFCDVLKYCGLEMLIFLI